jgi:putative IMPACT (imprinted ancient) family translation regulator
MLEVLKNRNLKDTTVVVTRYFGGIKLGAGGLVRAYSSSTSEALEKAGVEENLLANLLKISFGYEKYSLFLKFIEKYKHKIISQDFAEEISITIAIKVDDNEFIDKLTDCFLGKVVIKNEGQTFVVFGE